MEVIRRALVPLAIAGAALLTALLHLVYRHGSLLSDEGGFAMLARWWGSGGPYLYGPMWVDRPPGLIGVFWLADHGGAPGVRLMAGFWAVVFVLAAAWAAWAVRGGVAAAWAAWAALFLLCTPASQTFALNGEVVAATCTMVSVAAILHAVRRPPRHRVLAVLLAGAAGAAAGSAVLMKQNFLDGVVFVVVLLVSTAILGHRGERPDRRGIAVLGLAAALGCAVPWGIALTWAATHGGVDDLIYAMYGFRADAARVLAGSSHAAADRRMRTLAELALGSGMVTLGLTVLIAARRRFRRHSPLLLACLAAGLVEVVGVVLGGSFWAHYLIGLAPMLALAAGVFAAAPEGGRGLVRGFVVAPVLLVVASMPAVAAELDDPISISATTTWMRQAVEPGDTGVVLYTHANLIGATGLRPVYPYAWSLPVRTLDPRLDLLVATLERPTGAPTWVVVWDDLHDWGLDADGRVEDALAQHYVRVAVVDGHPIWLHRGLLRLGVARISPAVSPAPPPGPAPSPRSTAGSAH